MRTRRSVLSLGAGALAGVAGLPAWGRPEKQPGRAVVSVWLAGGDDSNNMVVPLDGRFEGYSRARGELSIEAGRLAVLGRTGASAGLHPSLASLVPIFEAGDLAIALNAGDLALRPSAMHHDYNFLEFMADGYTIPKWAAAIDARVVEERRPHLKLAGGGAVVGKARRLEAVRPAGPEFPHTRIGRDLGDALGVIIGGLEGAASPLVVQVVHSGFDTHRDQLAKQAALYQELAGAVAVFWETVAAYGLRDRVMLYTETEFSRCLTPNEQGGTEHGWGGHVLMLGGPYAGGALHGEFPSMEIGGKDDVNGRGTWRPAIERNAVTGAIARWAGVGNEAV